VETCRDTLFGLLEYLKEHGKAIAKAAEDGDVLAGRIMGTYSLVEARVEPAAVALLEKMISDYKKNNVDTKVGDALNRIEVYLADHLGEDEDEE